MMNKKTLLSKQRFKSARLAIKMATAVGVAAILCACASTFLVSKDCKTYYFGSTEEGLYKMLCTTGDLMRVLDDGALPPEMRAGLYDAQCVERSRDRVNALYQSLTSEQKSALKSAFSRHGYYVNYKPIGNYDFDNLLDNINFCPTGAGY